MQQTLKTIPALPSFGIAVVRDDRAIYVRGAGFRDVERRVPADVQSAYYIGSTTKAYTGLACAILRSGAFSISTLRSTSTFPS